MKKWEYDLELLDFVSKSNAIEATQTQLNEAGEAGWELVCLLPKMGHNEAWTIAILKREKQ